MKKVYKFETTIDDNISIAMPKGAQILTVQNQREMPCIWALVDNENEPEIRHFRLAGTGHDIADEIKDYIGTYQLLDGGLVFHLFEVYPARLARYAGAVSYQLRMGILGRCQTIVNSAGNE